MNFHDTHFYDSNHLRFNIFSLSNTLSGCIETKIMPPWWWNNGSVSWLDSYMNLQARQNSIEIHIQMSAHKTSDMVIGLVDYANVSFMVLILYYTYIRYYHREARWKYTGTTYYSPLHFFVVFGEFTYFLFFFFFFDKGLCYIIWVVLELMAILLA